MTYPVQSISSTPTELVAGLSLANGNYTLQNVGDAPLFLAQKATTQTDEQLRTAGGHVMNPGQVLVASVASDLLYAWCGEGSVSRIVVSTAV